jgi:hypothetical protein
VIHTFSHHIHPKQALFLFQQLADSNSLKESKPFYQLNKLEVQPKQRHLEWYL